jgi:hypothetical protein
MASGRKLGTIRSGVLMTWVSFFLRASPSLASETVIDLTQRYEDITGSILLLRHYIRSFDVDLWAAVVALVAGGDTDPADYFWQPEIRERGQREHSHRTSADDLASY